MKFVYLLQGEPLWPYKWVTGVISPLFYVELFHLTCNDQLGADLVGSGLFKELLRHLDGRLEFRING